MRISIINFLFLLPILYNFSNCQRFDDVISSAFRDAESEILPYLSHFSNVDVTQLNYTIAGLAAVKIAQRSRNIEKLPRKLCPSENFKSTCGYGTYRNPNGKCTNFENSDAGSIFQPFSRRIPANYYDEISTPLLKNSNFPREIFENFQFLQYPVTSHFWDFAQFLHQDLAKFSKMLEGFGCCQENSKNSECWRKGLLDCYIRSAPTISENCKIGAREQMNLATAFLDAGPIYSDVNFKDIPKGKISDFHLDSSGKNSIHQLLIEEHNWAVEEISKTFPDLQSEILFEEARKFVISELQYITFEEFLPILLGEETMDKYNLRCSGSECPKLNPNTLNEFGTVVGQFYKLKNFADFSEILLKSRDHGIATYAQWRHECGGGNLKNLEKSIDSKILDSVGKFYGELDDVDLLVFGLAENPVYGSLVGPTFGCILGLQFQKTKFGDSYWYSEKLTEDQLAEIRKTSISSILCRHRHKMQQKDGFRIADEFLNLPVPCNSSIFPKIDFSKFLDFPKISKKSMTSFDDVIDECIGKVLDTKNRQKRDSGNFNTVALKSYGSMMLAKDEAVLESNVSFVLLEVTKKLNKLDLQGVEIGAFGAKSDRKCNPKPLPCDPTDPYRSYTGWCNNLASPWLANTFRELRRVLPPVYEDTWDAPRGKSSRGILPSPRVISNAVHHAKKVEHVKYSHFLMEFGQFIDHDITHSPVDQNLDGTPLNCSRCDSHRHVSPSCFPITVPENDEFFEPFSCLSFVRSLPAQKTLGYRNQMNQVSAYLDGSVMYGSTKCEGDRLRTFQGGKMKKTRISSARRHYGITLSQSDESEQDGCVSAPEAPCFIAGDDRNSQQTLLIALHSVFHREHERLTEIFAKINPTWNDEKLYQETRKLVSAQFSHIVYNEYLPIIIGPNMVEKSGLRPLLDGHFEGYDTCDASILQPFATAAFRFGHSTVTRFTPFHKSGAKVVDLAADFVNMTKIYGSEKSVENILGGMHRKKQMATDRFVDDAIRNFLFSDRGKRGTGLDLISINIQRGRDHGIPPYNEYRSYCKLERLSSFFSIFSDIKEEDLAAIQKVYESPDDIDLFTGLIAEIPISGGIVGPTAACIISEQFRNLKKCDRFFYENSGIFSAEKLAEIRKTTMSNLICKNTKVAKIAKNVFSVPDPFLNPLIDCSIFPNIDYSKWSEADYCTYKNFKIPRHVTEKVGRCSSCTCTKNGIKCSFFRPECSEISKMELMEDPICFLQCAGRSRDEF